MRRRRSISWFKVGLWFIVGMIGFGICQNEYKIYQIKKETAAAEARIAVLRQEQASLQAEQSRLGDKRYIEKLAREEYNMVGKNEVPLFIVTEKK